MDSSDLVHKIHNEIKNSDQTSLSSGIKNITFLEKIGMLHQLADKLDQEIIWGKKINLQKVRELQDEK